MLEQITVKNTMNLNQQNVALYAYDSANYSEFISSISNLVDVRRCSR